jgi:hypothetical protein
VITDYSSIFVMNLKDWVVSAPLPCSLSCTFGAKPEQDLLLRFDRGTLERRRLSTLELLGEESGVMGGAVLADGSVGRVLHVAGLPYFCVSDKEGEERSRLPLVFDMAASVSLGAIHTSEQPERRDFRGQLVVVANAHGITLVSSTGCVALLSADGQTLKQQYHVRTHAPELALQFWPLPQGISGSVSWARRDPVGRLVIDGEHRMEMAELEAVHPGAVEDGLISIGDSKVYLGDFEDWSQYAQESLPSWHRSSGSDGAGTVVANCGRHVAIIRCSKKRMHVLSVEKPAKA